MPQLIYKQRKYPMVCLGDMIHRIAINTRTQTVPIAVPGQYSETFVKVLDVWAFIETVKELEMFDSSNVSHVVSHKMIIRWLPYLTSEYWIKYKNEYYKIVSMQDMENENRFQLLFCTTRGDIAKLSNWA